MNKEKLFKEKGIVRIPQFKKMWYSITKFEKYPEMATEGVGRSLLYLLFLSFIISLAISICVIFQIRDGIKESIQYFDKNVESISYENGNLDITLVGDKQISTEFATLIIDTSEISNEQRLEYEKSISENRMGIIWLKDSVIFKANGRNETYNYKEILDGFQISSFDKATILSFLKERVDTTSVYVFYFFSEVVILFITFIIATLADILVLSIFGVLTSMITKMNLRYRAIFNMSVYAVTLSAILQTIYRIAGLYTDFEIKYFDIMYTAIAFVYLAAAIFMIRSDVIKGQLELMKLQQEKEEKQEDSKEEEKEEEKKEEKEEKKQEEEKEDDENLKPRTEGEG